METMMIKRLTPCLLAALVLVTTSASADTLPSIRYAEMMKMKMMDTDKDGLVSREEYLAAVAKAYDMAVEAMKVKDGRMNANHLKEFRTALASPR
jgi:hypothetical protein